MSLSRNERLKRKRDSQRKRYATDVAFREQRKANAQRYRATEEYKSKRRAYIKTKWASDPIHRAKHAEHVRRAQRKSRYGLTHDQYLALCKSYRGCCGICHKRRKLVIDHDHKTGQVRGLLCDPCNTGLGKLGDTLTSAKRLLRYLTK